MKRLVLIGPMPPPYVGQSVGFKMLTEGLKERGISFHIINIKSKYKKKELDKITFHRCLEYLNTFVKYIFLVCSKNRKNIYITIAQSKIGFFRDFVFISFGRLFNHKIIAHLKGGNYDRFYYQQNKILRLIIRNTLLAVDIFIVLSEGLRNMYDFMPDLKERIVVIPNGLPIIPDKRISSDGKRLDKNKIIILFLSNMIESKGYLHILEAAKILKNTGKLVNIVFRFCGDFIKDSVGDTETHNKADTHEFFLNYIKHNNLDGYVEYVGVVNGSDKLNELINAHIFILPTNYHNEGQPVSMIEAMAYGCVLISTEFRAIPDMLIEGKNGYFVPFCRPDMIAATILKCIEEPNRYNLMSKYSLEHFNKYFTREQHLNRIVSIITD